MQSTATVDAAPVSGTRYFPVTKWPHAYPTQGGLRWLIFTNRDGFRDECVRQIGRRILVDETAFFAWVSRQGRGAK